MKLKFLTGLIVLIVIIQFFRPERNESNDITYDISNEYSVPLEVNNLLKVACNDCHSNKTEYPWYSNVQPVGWWLKHHVDDGKKHLNFSEFIKSPIFVQNHKFEEIIEMVEDQEMPLPSYTNFGLHSEADLSDDQRQSIINWAKDQMDYLARTYPADSLAFPPRN